LILKSQAVITTIDTRDYIKFKSFCTAKERVHSVNKNPTDREKILANYSPDNGYMIPLNKERNKETNKASNN
jgi:hypothetical protein